LTALVGACHTGAPPRTLLQPVAPAPGAATTPAPAPVPASVAPATTTTSAAVALPPPPYPVATTTVALVDASRPTVSRGVRVAATRALTTVVWYPTVGARWPLVVFAPGYQVGPETYSALCRRWAGAGYVVAAPRFPLSDPSVAGAALDELDLDNQPADVRFVMSSLVTSAGSGLPIDPTRIAVTGHSDGAEDALAVGEQGVAAVKAVIAMSGQPVPRQGPNPPLLVMQGDQDTVNPPLRSQAVFDQATSPRFLITLLGAGHLPPFSGGSKWQAVVEAVTVDFLDHYLAAITNSDAKMLADAHRPGLAVMK
jgi:dienelactone hydrolase